MTCYWPVTKGTPTANKEDAQHHKSDQRSKHNDLMTPHPPHPAEYSPRIPPDYSNNKISHTIRKIQANEQWGDLLSRAAAKTPRCGACRARARAAHRVIGDVGRKVRPGGSDEVHDRRDRKRLRLRTKPVMMRKRRRATESSMLWKCGGTEPSGAEPGRTAPTRH